MSVTTANTDVLTASLGQPIALAYGRHVVGGNVILKDETDADQTIVFLALGEGEWDAVEDLLVNGAPWDIASPENFQFHKGLAGERSLHVNLDGSPDVLYPEGAGSLSPFTDDGDQKVDTLTPPGVQGLTFSRTAYLALRIPFDVFAPSPEISVVGTFRTRKVRFFDASGVETGYAWSDNPAWQIADLLTRVRGLPDSRLDWASFRESADYAEELIEVNGEMVRRFVSHVAFTEEVDFDEALEAILATCRGFLTDVAGQIRLRLDQPRAPVFDFTMDNIVEGSFSASAPDTRGVANRLELQFRDLENNFALLTKLWNHEPQQARVGRVIPAKFSLGNLPQHQAERIGNYLLTRAIDNNLLAKLRATPASFALLPGDVVRLRHDAAPWSQKTFGDACFETFEVVEATDNPDETRDFVLRLYRDTTYPDTAGPTQNLIATTVRRRPQTPPPSPADWELSAFPRGHLWLTFEIPPGADYRTGDLILLGDDELQRVEATLDGEITAGDTEITIANAVGEAFLVGDFINIGQEVLKIVGPGVEGAPPTDTPYEVARSQKGSQASSHQTGDPIYRLAERHLHFVLTPGFTLARPKRKHTVDFGPGRLRILHAALSFSNPAGLSTPVELPFWADYEINPAIFGTLPGLRVSAGGLGTIQVPGPLATGSDLAMPLVLPEDSAIGLVYAQAAKSPFGGAQPGIGIQISIDGVPYGPAGRIPGIVTGGPTGQLVWLSGARRGNVGGKALSIEITEVGSTDPGEDLTVFVTI